MPKVYIASEARHFQAERTCSNCGHKWTASFDIGARSMAHSSREQAAKEARAMVAAERDDKLRNCDVVCPECGHFSEDAMGRHFSKAGYAGGIIKQYKRAMWMSFAGVFGFGWLPALVLIFGTLNPTKSDTPWLSVLWLVVVVGLGGIALYKFIGFVWGLAGLGAVRRKLNRMEDDQLRELAVECYKSNKLSLNATSFEEVRWNAWQTKPLLYKESVAATEAITR